MFYSGLMYRIVELTSLRKHLQMFFPNLREICLFVKCVTPLPLCYFRKQEKHTKQNTNLIFMQLKTFIHTPSHTRCHS